MLGSGAVSDLDIIVSADGIVSAPAVARAEKATTLVNHIDHYVSSQSSPSCLHIGWLLLSKCAASALSYDTRLVPPDTMSRIASRISTRIEFAARKWCGGIDEIAWRQMRLPGAFGGMGLRIITDETYSSAAYWSAWCSRAPSACRIAAAIGRPIQQAAGGTHAYAAKQALQEASVMVRTDGRVKLSDDAQSNFLSSPCASDIVLGDSMMNEPSALPPAAPHGSLVSQPVKKFCSSIWMHLDAIAAIQVHSDALTTALYRAETVLSAGGRGNGSVW